MLNKVFKSFIFRVFNCSDFDILFEIRMVFVLLIFTVLRIYWWFTDDKSLLILSTEKKFFENYKTYICW